MLFRGVVPLIDFVCVGSVRGGSVSGQDIPTLQAGIGVASPLVGVFGFGDRRAWLVLAVGVATFHGP